MLRVCRHLHRLAIALLHFSLVPLEATAESVDEETGVGWEELMEEDDGLEIFLVHAVEETCMDTHLTLAIRPTIIL